MSVQCTKQIEKALLTQLSGHVAHKYAWLLNQGSSEVQYQF